MTTILNNCITQRIDTGQYKTNADLLMRDYNRNARLPNQIVPKRVYQYSEEFEQRIKCMLNTDTVKVR